MIAALTLLLGGQQAQQHVNQGLPVVETAGAAAQNVLDLASPNVLPADLAMWALRAELRIRVRAFIHLFMP